MKVRKGDQVTVIAGDDKGKTGRVLQVIREKNRVIVEGVKFVKRHTRPTSAAKGGIVEKEAAIHISNVKKVG